MIKTVNVLMSTYNGEKYISLQIKSILNQEDVKVNLYIRDDGSFDKTIDIIREMCVKHKNIYLKCGTNLGWQNSFVSLLLDDDKLDADYYAFADQDDYWLPQKLKCAIEKIENSRVSKCLYYSARTFCDENLKVLPDNYKLNGKYSPKLRLPDEYYCLAHLPIFGCTMVFDYKLYEILLNGKYDFSDKIAHDYLVYVTATFCGNIVGDEKSYILYRRHDNTATKTKNSLKINRNILNASLSGRKIQKLSHFLYRSFHCQLSERQIKIVMQFLNMDKLNNKIILLFKSSVRNNTLLGTLYLKYAILLVK